MIQLNTWTWKSAADNHWWGWTGTESLKSCLVSTS